MLNFDSPWTPWLVGALIGLLSWVTFGAMGQALGTSTTAVRAAGGIARSVAPDHVDQNAYFRKYLGTTEAPKPVFDWQFALVLALPLGAWLSRSRGDRLPRERIPPLWAARFGPSRKLRTFWAFFGGVLLLFGARMAGGCTSGHGLSGTAQFALSSWVFFPVLFIAGITAAHLIYNKEARHG